MALPSYNASNNLLRQGHYDLYTLNFHLGGVKGNRKLNPNLHGTVYRAAGSGMFDVKANHDRVMQNLLT